MRTTRTAAGRWGIVGTAATALVTLGTVTGCGMAGGGISVVGANPATVPVVAQASSSDTGTGAGTATSTAAQGDAAVLSDKGASGATAQATATAAAAAAGGSSVTTAATTGVGSPAASPGAGTGTGATAPADVPTTMATSAGGACSSGALSLQVTAASSVAYVAGGGAVGGGARLEVHGLAFATRTQQLTLTFTNVSRASCTLRGYPSVDFLRGGIKGPLSAPDSFAPNPGVADVELSPGGVATAQVTFTANGAGNPHGLRCDQVVAVRVYAPGSTKALTSGAHDAAGHRIPSFYVCGHKVVVHAVQHG